MAIKQMTWTVHHRNTARIFPLSILLSMSIRNIPQTAAIINPNPGILNKKISVFMVIDLFWLNFKVYR